MKGVTDYCNANHAALHVSTHTPMKGVTVKDMHAEAYL